VKLTVIREGKPQVLTAKLAERDLMQVGLSRSENLLGDWVGKRQVVRMLPQAISDSQAVALDPPSGVSFVGPGGEQINAASVVIEDDQHKMSISSKAGKKQLRVEDKAGKIVFDGPIHTAEELGKVPTDVRDKIFKMGLQGLSLPASDAPAVPQPGSKGASTEGAEVELRLTQPEAEAPAEQ